MRTVVTDGVGGPEVLRLRQLPRPEPGPEELLVRVRASALNRGDVQQRAGVFTLPPGVNPVLGVEIAGEVVACGARVRGFVPGQRVFGLVNGGGYAEYCVMDHLMALPVPEGWSFTEAASVPEAFITADETLFELGGLSAGQTVLIHAAASGIGTVCVQLAHRQGAIVYYTAGSAEKLRRVRDLGGDVGIHRKEQDFVREVLRRTEGAGVDLVEDFAGGATLAGNLQVLKPGGCLLLVGVLDGNRGELDVEHMLLRRLQIKGTSFRGRPIPQKRAISHRVWRRWAPELLSGRVRPVIDSVFPLEKVADAHRHMEAGEHFGKILLTLEA